MSLIDLTRKLITPDRYGYNWVYDVVSRCIRTRNNVLNTIIPKSYALDPDSDTHPIVKHKNERKSIDPNLAAGRWIILEMARHAYFTVESEIKRAVQIHKKEKDKRTALDIFPAEEVAFFEWFHKVVHIGLIRRARKYPEIQDYYKILKAYKHKYVLGEPS